MKKRVLVFPCGSEIANEIYRSLEYSIHFELIGANSINDYGRFLYKDYIGDVPFIDSPDFIESIKTIVKQWNIDFIYPAMDGVMAKLKSYELEIGCRVVGSPVETVNICLSKSKSYDVLQGVIAVPKRFAPNEIDKFPVFAKPDIGYGSRGSRVISTKELIGQQLEEHPGSIFCEYLTGKEYTVDCFTDKDGKLRFVGPRERGRIVNGISVNTYPVREEDMTRFYQIVNKVNERVRFRGAWFIQLKENEIGELVLLEIAARLGGSSSLYRMKGVNFAMLTLFDAMDYSVDILENDYDLELGRALTTDFKINISYNEVFVDFDDCLYLKSRFVNAELVSFLYNCLNQKIKLTLLTRHKGNLQDVLFSLRLNGLFDRIIHLGVEEKKSQYIDNLNSIFIDDSYAERKDVSQTKGIFTFSPDMVRGLINSLV